MDELPTRKQLLLPLLETLAKNGGKLKSADAVNHLAQKLDISKEIQEESTHVKEWKKTVYPWRQHVHWTRMDAVSQSLITSPERGVWELTDKGFDMLGNCTPGVIFTIFETARGQAVWATAETAVGELKDESVNLVFTSPPYPLEGNKKQYGNLTGAYYTEWLLDIASQWKRAITPDGSILLNLADVWNKGSPTRSLYIEKLLLGLCEDIGLHLADRCFWECPNRIPASYWVTHKRVRLNSSHEHLLWLSKSPFPKADNKNVLEPYKNLKAMQAMQNRVIGKAGPNGHLSSKNAFKTIHEGRIPHSVMEYANASSTDGAFAKECRLRNLEIHPARMPLPLAKFWLKFLTDEEDHVHDSFIGSGVTALAAEQLNRIWSGCDRSLLYLNGAHARLDMNNIYTKTA
jgi:DNA modification methylase